MDLFTIKMKHIILPLLNINGGQFTKVKCLCLANGNQSSLPPILRICDELEELDLGYNSFRYLPFWLTKLKNLKTLKRFGNPLIFQVRRFGFIDKDFEVNSLLDIKSKCNNEIRTFQAPSSLFLIAATAVLLKTDTIQSLMRNDYNRSDMPRELFADLVLIAAQLNFCDQCNQPFCCKSCKYVKIIIVYLFIILHKGNFMLGCNFHLFWGSIKSFALQK